MSIESWEHFFKPEVRSAGRRYVDDDAVSVPRSSDTEIQTYIRGSTSHKVTLKTESIGDELLTVDCNCPASKKGQFCKHIWAVLLAVEEKRPDFLESKTEIQKVDLFAGAAGSAGARSSFQARPRVLTEKQIEAQAAMKAKQSDYRKEQYQKQKQRVKAQKDAKKKSKFAPPPPSYPEDVEEALAFFSQNGFPLEESLDASSVGVAKKKLSRVFHPDIGGTHDEILQLNANCDVLLKFIGSQS